MLKLKKTGEKKRESIYYTCVGFIIEQYHFFLFVVLAHGKLMSVVDTLAQAGIW